MKKVLKCSIIILCLIAFNSCKKSNEIDRKDNDEYSFEDIEYISVPIEELNKLDSYSYKTTIDNTKYNFTYYFKDGKCVGSKEELVFPSSEIAKKYYDELKEKDETIELKVNANKVTYYLKSEYLEYLLYPKEALIDILNDSELE